MYEEPRVAQNQILPTVLVKMEVLGITDNATCIRVTNIKGQKIEMWLGKGGTITYDWCGIIPEDIVLHTVGAHEVVSKVKEK